MVVTADRRTKSLQKYAGAVSALSQEDLERSGVNSVRDLTTATPYVSMGTQEGNTEIFIRGIGSNYNTELGDPAAAMHMNGVYIPRPRGVGSMLFDVERVEISRGPQGTLRGRNATAGAINLVTHAPVLDEWAAEASLQLGNYSQRLGRGMVNIPLGDRFAVRLATYFEAHSPFFTNAGPIQTLQASDSADTLAYRVSALWLPVDKLKINIRNDYTQEGGTGNGGSNYFNALSAGLLPQDVPDPRAVVYRGPQGSQDVKHWGVDGDARLDLGPVSFGYLGSYRDLSYTQISPGNVGVAFPGMPAPDLDNWGTNYWHTTSQSVVQELRVFAPDNARLRWTVGGFFFNEAQTVFLGSTADDSNGYAGQEYNHPKMNSRSYAGYADATYDILEFLRATAGVRYTTETKARDGIGYQYRFQGFAPGTMFRFGTEGFRFKERDRTDYQAGTSSADQIQDFRAGVASFGARDTLDAALNQPGVSVGANSLQEQHGKYSGQFVDFRVGSDIDLGKDNLLYLMFSTGHQSGGFNDNIIFPNGESIAPGYKPEALYATELGSKNRFFDGRLTANLAAFWYHYVNQQFSQVQSIFATDVMGSSAASLVRFNAATSRVLGLEADVNARLPAGLQLDLSVMLLDARITSGVISDARFPGPPTSLADFDLAGQFLPRAPVLSLNYGIRQNISTSVGKFYWMAKAQTKTLQYMTVYNSDGHDTHGNLNPTLSDVVPGYTLIDLGVGYMRPDGRLRLEAFCLNLTDTIFMASLNSNPYQNVRFFNLPRQIGVRMTMLL
jgi:iron complex outermembrane recepter protein